MQDDFTPIIRTLEGNNDVTIYPISDLHIGANECLVNEWAKFKKKLISEPNSYITIGGDMMNNSIKGSIGNTHAEKLRPREQKAWLIEQLKDIKDKILCVCDGNHEWRTTKESDDYPLYDMCYALGLENLYRENGAIIILRIGNIKGNGMQNPTYCGCVTHGSGGGFLTGSAVNKNERFGYVFDGLDFLIVGHTHKPVVSTPSKIVIDKHNKKVSLKPFKVITSTAWLNYGGYAFRKMMLPASFNLNWLQLYGNEKKMEVTM